jgi:leucyl-tRNA synthetase
MGLVAESEPFLRRMNRGLIMGPDGQKMSKSKGNVVDPDQVVGELGADTVRMYLAFIGPYNEVGAYPWNPGGAVGVRRFLDRVARVEVSDAKMSLEIEVLVHRTIKKVSDDIASLKLNTAVSALMILLNELQAVGNVPRKAFETFVTLLAPFAPHLAHELAEQHGISLTTWPTYDESKITSAVAKVTVQINGKVRTSIELDPSATEEEAVEAAKMAAAKWLTGPVSKAIYKPGKVVNLVVEVI